MSSRFYDDWDDDPWRSRLLWVDIQRALKTKPGYKALVELREALLGLPEKTLLQGQACAVPYDEETDEKNLAKPKFCAMGAWLFYKRIADGEDPSQIVDDLSEPRYSSEDYGYEVVMEISDAAKRLGMAKALSNHIQWINDGDDDLSGEQRFEYVLRWTEDQIKRSPHHGSQGSPTP